MQGNIFLIAGIILFVFLVWIAAGGPLTTPSTFSQTDYDLGTASSSLTAGTKELTEREASREIARIQDEVVDLQRSAVAAARFGDPSPYKDIVSLSLGTAGRSDDAEDEYVSISVSGRAEEPISITGWRIFSSARGLSLSIPTGVPLPRSSKVNIEEAVILNAGERATITTGESPVGMSFKENQCTGYFDQFQEFVPSLPHQCPYARDDLDRFYMGSGRTLDACRAYLSKVPRCEIPRERPSNIGSECQDFIDSHLDYNGCVDAHLGDRDFFDTDWRIYLEENDEFFTKEHDTIKLLDADGKTVDLVSY